MNVGDIVSWESQSGGFKTKKVGTIMAVVPAKSSASLFIPEGFACNSKSGYGLSRDHESYLVKVKGKGRKLYWPLVKHLHSQKDTVREAEENEAEWNRNRF